MRDELGDWRDANAALLGITVAPERRRSVRLHLRATRDMAERIYTQPISFIGLPVVVAPVPQAGAMPIGAQVITAPWREDLALRIAYDLEARGVARARRPSE
jgi:Asp-tRNA(Asn)/Glu-tRNA(Gln) amidotransferase A subunit family amidase